MNTFETLEQMRLRARNGTLLGIVLIAVGFLLFLPMPFIGFPMFVGGIIAGIVADKKVVKPYKAAYKEMLVRGLLSERIDDLRFDPNGGIDRETVKSTDMMNLGNIYEVNDLIEGFYNGVHFSQSDILIQQRSGGKTASTTTYLKGRWLVFDFSQSFYCDLQVRDRKFSYAKKSGGWFSEREKTQKLETESEEFNRIFKVYADNESEALAILTPHFMKALMRAREQADGEVLFCFVDRKLHVAVNNHSDGFEPPVWSPIDQAAAREAILSDLRLITDLIDTLNLDERLFVGE
jgi:hypothetical protein